MVILRQPQHAPGSRDSKTRNARPGHWATELQMEAIAYLAASDEPVRAEMIGRDLAHEGESMSAGAVHQRGTAIIQPLRDLGIVRRVMPTRFALTERGRIAAALILARHPSFLPAYFDEDLE